MNFHSDPDTCRKYLIPILTDAGSENEPHSIAEQPTFPYSQIIVAGEKV